MRTFSNFQSRRSASSKLKLGNAKTLSQNRAFSQAASTATKPAKPSRSRAASKTAVPALNARGQLKDQLENNELNGKKQRVRGTKSSPGTCDPLTGNCSKPMKKRRM